MSVQYSQQGHNVPSSGDSIAQLPVDQNPPSPNEVQIINTLFKKHRSTMEIIMDEAKDSVLAGVLVILFTLPQVDGFINKLVPMTEKSIYVLVLIKGLVAIVAFWLIKHLYLSRKGLNC